MKKNVTPRTVKLKMKKRENNNEQRGEQRVRAGREVIRLRHDDGREKKRQLRYKRR